MAILGNTTTLNLDMPYTITGRVFTLPLVSALTITDTTAHNPTTDANVGLADLRRCGGNRTLLVQNTLSQTATIIPWVSYDGVNGYALGTGVTVTSGTNTVFDSTTMEQLGQPYPFFGVQISCTVAPTGSISVTMAAKAV